MPLLLVDLDNTLIDRAGAFARWAREFTSARGGDQQDVAWLVASDWVISEGAGIRKPDPEIFRLAAAQAGQPLRGAWMIGDSAAADIGGARNAGLPGVWLHRGRPWPLTEFQPGHTADSFPDAVRIVLTAGS